MTDNALPDHTLPDVALPIEIPLDPPLAHAGRTFDRLVVDREPNVGDLAAMDAFTGDVMKSVALFSSLTGVPVPALKVLSARRFAEVAARLEPLLGNAPAPTAGPT